MVTKLGEMPLTSYRLPGVPAVADLIQQKLLVQPGIRGVLIERLGPMVWSITPEAPATCWKGSKRPDA